MVRRLIRMCLIGIVQTIVALVWSTPVAAAPDPTTDSADAVNDLELARTNLINATAGCQAHVRSTSQLRNTMQVCQSLIDESRAQLDGIRRMRNGKLSDAVRQAAEEVELKAVVGEQIGSKELAARTRELPLVPLGDSSWSLSLQAFVGLMRIRFGDTDNGISDDIRLLSGFGTGVKLRWDGYNATGERFEIFGANIGVFYEPNGDSMSQTMGALRGSVAALVVLSTYQHFYVGAGTRFASTEPGFVRGFTQDNFLMVLGLGADGKSL